MNKPHPFQSLRGKLILSLLLFVIIPTLLIFWNYAYTSRNVVEQEVNLANQELADRTARSVNDVATRMIKALLLLETDFENYYGPELSEWSEDYTEYMKVQLLQRRMTTIRDLLLDSSAFLLYTDYAGLSVSTFYSFDMKQSYPLLVQEDWYRQAREGAGFPHWILPLRLDPRIGNVEQGSSQGYFAMSRSLRDRSVFGTALIGVPIPSVFPSEEAGHEQTLPSLLLWDGGQELNDPQGRPVKTLSDTETKELRRGAGEIKQLAHGDSSYMANVSFIKEMRLYVVSLVPRAQFLSQLSAKQNQSMLSIIAVFLISTMVFLFFLLRFTKPIQSMLRSMRQVGSGDFQTSVPVKGHDEIALLSNNFNRMVERLRDLLTRVEEEQRQKEEAHFQSLQAQINPHFLFNTLNSIKLMAMLSNTNRNVSDMITALGKLLEFSMKMNQRFVTLGQEIEYLELYLSLQKIRYQDQITLAVDVPAELKALYVLKFTLQPLIENSIMHGGRMPLHISIRAEAQSQELTILIRDNGRGVSEAKLAELQETLVQPHAKYSGIGISNVDRRIKMHFGDPFGIRLHSLAEGGLEVTVRFPIRKEPPL